MSAFYIQQAGDLFPIYGVSSLEEARRFADGARVIETGECIYMNQLTGSVDVLSGWDGVDTEFLVEVTYCDIEERWVD